MSDGRKKPSSSSSFHFIAGLGSGLTSAVLLQPADLLKTRVQQSGSSSLLHTIRTISTQPQPFRQLWRGTLPSTIRTSVGSALYFTSLNALRQHFARLESGPVSTTAQSSSSSLPKLSGTANMATGALARASVGFVMMPITVIKVRFESDLYAYRSLAGASRDIMATSGLRGFFAGFGATALRDAPYAGLYVLFYERSKAYLSGVMTATTAATAAATVAATAATATAPTVSASAAWMGGGTAASVNFVSGMLAAGLATALTNPPDAVKTRLQLRPEKYRNMVQAARLMLKEEGVRSLFDGLALRVARKGLSSALAWTVYEDMIRRAERRWGVDG